MPRTGASTCTAWDAQPFISVLVAPLVLQQQHEAGLHLTLLWCCRHPLHASLLFCRALREEMYRASITRASSGDIDNTPIIEKAGWWLLHF